MAFYQKKPIVIEAVLWNIYGDHQAVREFDAGLDNLGCSNCGGKLDTHGFVATLEGGGIVCPGDWIITGDKGEYYPCKPDIFELTYDKI